VNELDPQDDGASRVRVAAVGDLHVGPDSAGHLAPCFEQLAGCADLLLLAGDLTRVGRAEEAEVLAAELASATVPIVAVLGNHDYHTDQADRVAARLAEASVQVLEGEACVVPVNDVRVGIAGVKGFGGGFAGRCGSDFGEPEMKAFINHTVEVSGTLERALAALTTMEADIRVALLHYAPVPDTCRGEPLEIFPFLGSYLLAEAIDRTGADVVFHGHAHRGNERGMTPAGVRVRNVAQPVIGAPFHVYSLPARQAAGGRAKATAHG
jgi:Icc-related predicted phosphoesterase